ncbi:hypothetical protein H5410_061564 [Solanum commersonii]|uniref:Uncharacterized protein n=1 Tax=Solanum commersonii TaxID=4109 RepID=A0A9J5WA05_SOLCO|nr:hypothetical protein H5410_061564 [Solanum commersonii]
MSYNILNWAGLQEKINKIKKRKIRATSQIRGLEIVVIQESRKDMILFKELENVEYHVPLQTSSALDGAQLT